MPKAKRRKGLQPTKPHYIVSSIALDPNGFYHVHYIGDIPEQGGMRFGAGSTACVDLDAALEFAKYMINQNEAKYMELIKEKSKWKEKKAL